MCVKLFDAHRQRRRTRRTYQRLTRFFLLFKACLGGEGVGFVPTGNSELGCGFVPCPLLHVRADTTVLSSALALLHTITVFPSPEGFHPRSRPSQEAEVVRSVSALGPAHCIGWEGAAEQGGSFRLCLPPG